MPKPLVLMGPRDEHLASHVIMERLLNRTPLGLVTLGVLIEGVGPADVLKDMGSQCEIDTFLAFGDLVDEALGIKPALLDPVITLPSWQMNPVKVIALPGLSSRHWENPGYYQYVEKLALDTYQLEIADLTSMLGARLN